MRVNGAISNYKKYFFLVFIISSLVVGISPQEALGISPSWPGVFTISDGGVIGAGIPTTPVIVTVNDISASGAGKIQVHISSSVDPTGFNLTLTEGPLGTFSNTNLALMSENIIATATSSLTITIFDDRFEDPLIIQTLPSPAILIVSDTDKFGITPIFTETGVDTNLFTATIFFGETTDSSTNTIAVIPGDIFTVYDLGVGVASNGFISPNPNIGKGGIFAEVGGTVTATYQGDSSSFVVFPDSGPGRGSGGLIRPGLVADSSSGGSDGGDCSNCTPPTLGVDSNFNRIVQEGFSFNGNGVEVEQYYTPYPLITTTVGEENTIVLKIFDDGGTQNIQHVSLAYGLGKGQFFSESKAIINLDRTLDGRETISTFDPENVLDDVKIETSKDVCNNFSKIQCLKVTMHHTFRDILEFNIVSTNVWDSKKNAWQNFYNHGIEVVGDSLNPPKTKMVSFGEKNMRGLFELTEIDKKKHLWTDEFGNLYEDKGNDYFNRVFYTQNQIKLDKTTTHGCDRNCNGFESYKLQQTKLAEKIFDGIKIKGEFSNPIFSYSYQMISRAEDSELQRLLITEQIKAEEKLAKLLDPSGAANLLK